MLAMVAARAMAAGPSAAVTGGCDPSGHNYEWTIVHDHESPLVYVEIPHFRADMFSAPDGWTTEIINQNSPDLQPGKCIAQVTALSTGLRRGEKGEFTMRINAASAQKGRRAMRLRFADRAEIDVMATIPIEYSSLERYLVPLVLGGSFGLYLLVITIRSNRRRRAVPAVA